MKLGMCMSVHSSVRLKIKILITAEPIGLYSSGNIDTGPAVVLGYFVGGGIKLFENYGKENHQISINKH